LSGDDFEKGMRVISVMLGAFLLVIGLSSLFSRPIINLGDLEGTFNSIIKWFFDVGGGLLTTIIGFGLFVLGVYPKAFRLLLRGRLR